MNLAVFDIDGTLTDTSKIDAACYVQAFQETFGIDLKNGNWESYTHYTDAGIAIEVIARAFKRPARKEDLDAVKATFHRLLEAAHVKHPEDFREIPGAANALSELRKRTDWAAAVATGCWQKSAELKLQYAGMADGQTPLAHCDHHIERERIVRKAIDLARQHYGMPEFHRTVYVGDGLWDVRTTRRLALPFVGIAHASSADRLQKMGAKTVLTDYRDLDSFMHALATACPPGEEKP